MGRYEEKDVRFEKSKLGERYFIPVDGLNKSDYPFFVVDIKVIEPRKLEVKRAIFRANFSIGCVGNVLRDVLSEKMFGIEYKDVSSKDKIYVDEDFDEVVEERIGLAKRELVHKANELFQKKEKEEVKEQVDGEM